MKSLYFFPTINFYLETLILSATEGPYEFGNSHPSSKMAIRFHDCCSKTCMYFQLIPKPLTLDIYSKNRVPTASVKT